MPRHAAAVPAGEPACKGGRVKKILVLNSGDNVGNAIEDIVKGDEVKYVLGDKEHRFTATSDVPFAFKIAIAPIAGKGDIIKYGELIGRAARDIAQGECVHIHNVEGKRGRGDKKGGGA